MFLHNFINFYCRILMWEKFFPVFWKGRILLRGHKIWENSTRLKRKSVSENYMYLWPMVQVTNPQCNKKHVHGALVNSEFFKFLFAFTVKRTLRLNVFIWNENELRGGQMLCGMEPKINIIFWQNVNYFL